MNKSIIINILSLIFVFIITSCGGSKDGNNETAKASSTIVEYENTVDMMGILTTTKTTEWKDQKNDRTAKYSTTETKAFGQVSKEESLEINDGKHAYNINLIDKTGTKTDISEMKNTAMALAAGMAMNIDLSDMKSLEDFVVKNGGKMYENETFLGKSCTVYEVMGMKQWLYKGIVLKALMGDKVMINAVKIEEDAKISDDKFEIPVGITITDAHTMPEM